MTTRREFLKRAGAAAGIVFCGCWMHEAARAQVPAPAQLPVMVGGKRVKTVDVHSHCLFHEALNLLGNEARSVLPPTKGVEEHFIVIDERHKAMDAMGIDLEVLSINPFWYRKERDLAAEIVRVQNEKLVELTASRPDRFAAFASLSLQFPELAVEQLDRAIKQQGLKGAPSAAASRARIFPHRAFTRSGPRRRSLARCCSSILRARRSWLHASKATAGFRTRSVIRSTRRSRSST